MRRATSTFVAWAGVACFLLAAPVCHSKPLTKPVPGATPKGVAQYVYDAWQHRQAKAARKVADAEAVEKLFSVRWRAMKFEGCKQRDEGGFECTYRDLKNDFSMAMIVDGGVSVGGYNVASLSFSTEE